MSQCDLGALLPFGVCRDLTVYVACLRVPCIACHKAFGQGQSLDGLPLLIRVGVFRSAEHQFYFMMW